MGERAEVRDALGEMYGDHATQGEAILIASGETIHHPTTGKPLHRTRFGGSVLSPLSINSSWERHRGTMIFIPQTIDVCVEAIKINDLTRMMVNFLTADINCDGDGDDEHKLWTRRWP